MVGPHSTPPPYFTTEKIEINLNKSNRTPFKETGNLLPKPTTTKNSLTYTNKTKYQKKIIFT